MGMASCELRDELRSHHGLEENEGLMELTLEAKGQSGVSTKTLVDGQFDSKDVDVNNYTVRVVNSVSSIQAAEISYKDLMLQGGKLALTEGKYTVLAFNYDGANVDASTRPFFLGTANFQILPGKSIKVGTTCTLQNIEIGIKLDPAFLNDFNDDYTITVTNGEQGNHVFNKLNIDKKIYLKVPANPVNSLKATIKATTKAGDPIIAQAEISKPQDAEGGTALKPGDSFIITLYPGSTPVTQYQLGITVDLTMTETNETIQIPTENIVFTPGTVEPPAEQDITITGVPASYTLTEAKEKAIVDINAPRGIQKLLVKIQSDNEGFNGTIAGFGLAGQFDLANPGDLLPVLSGNLEAGEGIGLIDPSDPILGKTQYTFDVRNFMTLLGLYGKGNYTFSIEVQDGVDVKSGDLDVTAP